MAGFDPSTVEDWRFEIRTGTYHASYDPGAHGSIGQALIAVISEVSGVPPEELDVLYETIDPAWLDDLIRSNRDDRETPVTVSFRYESYDVTVRSDGRIMVRAPEGSARDR